MRLSHQAMQEQRSTQMGEAKAQWSAADLTAASSEIVIWRPSAGKANLCRIQLNCFLLNTSFKSLRDCKMSTPVTLYHFRLCFGDMEWEIIKRYSDFDVLDETLMNKYGLPAAHLPPKTWFGLSNPELIEKRHKVLNAYLNDCVKQNVLVSLLPPSSPPPPCSRAPPKSPRRDHPPLPT
jgi:hypothetical protein